MKLYSANKDNLSKYLNSPKTAPSQIETVPNTVEQSLTGSIQSHNETITVPNRECNSPKVGTIINKEKNELGNKDNKNDIISVILNYEPTVPANPMKDNVGKTGIDVDSFIEKHKQCFVYGFNRNSKIIKWDDIMSHTPDIIIDLVNNPDIIDNYNDVCKCVKEFSHYFDAGIKMKVFKYLTKN